MSGFTGVTSGLKYPLTQTAFNNSQAGVNVVPQPTYLVGQTLVAQPVAAVPVTSVAQAQALFGAASHLARMFTLYFVNDPNASIMCVPLADAAGATAASGMLTFTGAATGNGTLFIYIAGQLVTVGVSAGQTNLQIAANVVAAVTALTTLPVSAHTATGVVTFTALNAGTLGNSISLALNLGGLQNGQALPAGVSCSVTPMSGGATDPSLAAIPGLIGDAAMRFLVQPYGTATALGVMQQMFSAVSGRWAPNRKSWGHHWTAHSDTVANLQTYGTTTTLNDPHTLIFAYETGCPNPPWEMAAAFCGACAPSIRQQPNLPVQYLTILGIMAPPVGALDTAGGAFSKADWQLLLSAGLALAQWGPNGNTPMVLRAPTTYQTNSAGQPDQSYFDTLALYTLMAIADQLNGMETQQWARVLLAQDGTPLAPGIPAITPKTAMANIMALYLTMESLGLVQNAAAMASGLQAVINQSNPGELDITFPPSLVVGLVQVTNTVVFNYSTTAAAVAVLNA